MGYQDGKVLVCDQVSSTTFVCDPCTLSRSPMFESDFVVAKSRKRKRATLQNSVSMKAARSLSIMKAAVTQLKDDASALASYRAQVEAEESWSKEVSAQMESSYYFMKSKAADIVSGPPRDSDDETGGPLLLENGPGSLQRDGGLIVVNDLEEHGTKETSVTLGHTEWSPQRMIAGM